MSVIITKNGKDAQKIDRTRFVDENELQEYLYENPDVIPIYEIDEDIKLLILAREFSTNSGPIDALGVDINGNIYIVETKLYKNPDKRTVIAQAIDYGASMWAYYKDFSDFVTRLDSEINKKFDMSLNQKLSEFFEIENDEVDLILETMKENLNKGVFKFVVLMDQLETRLKDLIRFINQNSQFDVYAVELEYYKFEKHELMIPKIYGAEVKKDLSVLSTGSARKKWDETLFFEELSSKVNNEQYKSIRQLYNYFKKESDAVRWGSGGTRGSFNVTYRDICPRSIITVWTDGILSINFGWLNESTAADGFREDLIKELKDFEGLKYDENTKYQNFDVNIWVQHCEWIKATITRLVNKNKQT